MDFAGNAACIAAINQGGIQQLCWRNQNYDVAGVDPSSIAWSAGAECRLNAYAADQTGTTSGPKLVVTYTVGGGTPFHAIEFVAATA
jgi:hypothetical protein